MRISLQRNATAEEARTAAGLSVLQWRSFYRITRLEARAITKDYPGLSWANIPAFAQEQVFERVKAQLASEHCPTVELDIFLWRMPTAVRDQRNTGM
ncbi:hypothetical protein M011DRAFT_465548 [Sporormia fimetaria CBS 119925]|uniref:Uncharacterized protein n=1 Tax=Sporormia fimetaria CBS 119925 TaxID=1340428 RepID=A0A6A6VK11_9PLEO|nr:hypothetical protein M011DRAFT_465548 [Sporormia fimetaria CBS 119925]